MVGGRRTPESFLAQENRPQLGHARKQAEMRGGDCGSHTRLPFPRTRPGRGQGPGGWWPGSGLGQPWPTHLLPSTKPHGRMHTGAWGAWVLQCQSNPSSAIGYWPVLPWGVISPREPVDAAEARGLPTSLPLRRTFLCRRQESRHSETKHAFKKIECVYKKHKMPLQVYCFSDTNFISTRRKFQS